MEQTLRRLVAYRLLQNKERVGRLGSRRSLLGGNQAGERVSPRGSMLDLAHGHRVILLTPISRTRLIEDLAALDQAIDHGRGERGILDN